MIANITMADVVVLATINEAIIVISSIGSV
jgi:hypothetical protein